jgi:hypothetical protein
MKRIPEQEIRKVLSDLPPEDVEAVVTFVNSICRKRAAEGAPSTVELSDAEHARILSILDSVAALSLERGPAVSNRDHDDYLYRR